MRTRASLYGPLAMVVAAASFTVSGQAPGQSQNLPQSDQSGRPTFQSNVDLTLVDFRVIDWGGTFIGGLTQDDFVVREDGKEQPISMFQQVSLPTRTIGPRDVTTLSGSNVESNQGTEDGHLYLLLFDDVSSHPLRGVTMRAIAREFIEEHLADSDQMAIVPLSGRRDMIQEFTRNRQVLLSSADKLMNGFGAPMGGQKGRYLTSLMKWLGEIEGRRKAVVYVTENVSEIVAPHSMELDEVLGAAAAAGVSFYLVDPTGVPTGAAKGIRPVPLDDVLELSASDIRRQDLRALAFSTGGLALTTTSNDFSGAFDRIVEENSSYYLLGYPSTNTRDGKFHKIDIDVKRDKLRVRARTGYKADKPSSAAVASPVTIDGRLASYLGSPIAVPGLALTVSAVPLRGTERPNAELAVILQADAEALVFDEDGARFSGEVDLRIVVVDQDGKTRGEEDARLTIEAGSTARDRIQAQGVRVLSSMDLKPGRYHLKIGAADVNGGRVGGLVQYDVVVPDFWKAPLAISGIALAASSSDDIPTSGSALSRWQGQDMLPTTAREFTSDDEVRAYVEVYRDTSSRDPIEVAATVRSPSGAILSTRTSTIGAAASDRQAMLPVGISGLDPGDYQLLVTANAADAKTAARQEIPFRVR